VKLQTKRGEAIEDNCIVELYWARSESAVLETSLKYGKHCYAIAYNILFNAEDADESVNDTYMGAWNSMPPHHPSVLSTFLGKITRRVSLNKWKERRCDKRGGGELELALDELSDCISSSDDIQQAIEVRELSNAINSYLLTLPETERNVVCRYWFFSSIIEISEKFSFSQSKIKSMLFRTRGKLHDYLQKEGFN
jgi:RNA polymerase sigma-70 factor (ECF subfamily)